MNKYSIYPSLLDSYTYMMSLENANDREVKRRELINKLNRIPQPPTEAASLGTALNAIIDNIIMRRETKEGMTAREGMANGDYPVYNATMDGFSFCYDAVLVNGLYNEFHDCLPQVFTKADIEIPQGIVTLYGYADYVRNDEVIDLKTTSYYNVGKFRDHWQHIVYPYCLVQSGQLESFDTFTYLVAEICKGRDGIIHANLYKEDYNLSMDDIERRIRQFLAYEFIPFLEDNRHLITDNNIFI